VLGGSLEAWSGEVRLGDRELSTIDRRAVARTIAIVAQENPIAFQFSALEVVLMGRAPHLGAFHLETAHDLELARSALAVFGLSEIAGRSIQELSGGERKRVFLARAVAQETRLILLDEPAAFLDLRHVAEIFTLFRKLCSERGTAVVATVHDLNAAALYADHVLLLNKGVRAAYGTPAEVLTSANLSAAYQTGVYVGHHPSNGAIMIWPETGAGSKGADGD
jgi:iron complex transport system ATP-binding protein